jgi:hypothetical protein
VILFYNKVNNLICINFGYNFCKNLAKLWFYIACNEVPKIQITNSALIARVFSKCRTLVISGEEVLLKIDFDGKLTTTTMTLASNLNTQIFIK